MRWKFYFDKNGASAHFEMIVAFVLFIGFVTFLMIFIRPTGGYVLQSAVVDSLHNSFLENTQTNLTKIFLRADYFISDKDCFYVVLDKDFLGVNFDGMKTYVKDLNGNYRESDLVDDNLKINKGASNEVDDTCFRVLVSSVFSNSDIQNCERVTNYKIGSVFETKIISAELLEEIELEYENGYDGLKEKLKIPSAFDFSIVSDSVVMEKEIPESVEVFSGEYLEEVLYSNGEIINERFVMKIW